MTKIYFKWIPNTNMLNHQLAQNEIRQNSDLVSQDEATCKLQVTINSGQHNHRFNKNINKASETNVTLYSMFHIPLVFVNA